MSSLRLSALIVLATLGCVAEGTPEVVVYVALDPIFSEAILQDFEKESGIRVRVQMDTEATKTTGLVERLRREKAQPRCDVFWNNEVLRTIRLAREGVLTPYESPQAESIPPRFRDPRHYWTGFAARARVVAFDPVHLKATDVPRTWDQWCAPRWKGQGAIANPQFGTTGTHLAFLFALWGPEEGRRRLQQLVANEVTIVASNGTSRNFVVSGKVRWGLTDTDDVEVARRQGDSVDDAFAMDGGVIVIPNTLALVANSPNPDAGKKLIDYLLRPEVEARLAASSSRQIPVRDSVKVPDTGIRLKDLTPFPVSFEEAADALPQALAAAREILR